MCTLISAASGTSSADVSLAWEMTELKKVNVLVYGQTGAGKSTLIGEIIGQASLGGASTKEVSISKTASGIAFVDRPGIDIPGAQGTSAEAASDCQQAWFTSALRSVSTWANEQAKRSMWKKTLADLDRRLKSNSAEDRPLALVYVHKAGNPRLYKDHVIQILSKAHALLVPTFVVVADKWSADRPSLQELMRQIRAMIAELGPNRRQSLVQCHVLSARSFESGTTVGPSTGVGEFVSSLLSHLQPEDAITFIRPASYFGSRRYTGPVPPISGRVESTAIKREAPDASDEADGDDGSDDEPPAKKPATAKPGAKAASPASAKKAPARKKDSDDYKRRR